MDADRREERTASSGIGGSGLFGSFRDTVSEDTEDLAAGTMGFESSLNLGSEGNDTKMPGTAGLEESASSRGGLGRGGAPREEDIGRGVRFGSALRAAAGAAASVVGESGGKGGIFAALRRSPTNVGTEEVSSFRRVGAALAREEVVDGAPGESDLGVGQSLPVGGKEEGEERLELFEITGDPRQICGAPVGDLKVCIMAPGECRTGRHVKERGKPVGKRKAPPGPGFVVKSGRTPGRAGPAAYREPHLPASVASASPDFQSTRREALGLGRWTAVFQYLQESADAPGMVAPKTVKRLKGEDKVKTPRKRTKFLVEDLPEEPMLPGGYEHTAEWLRQWHSRDGKEWKQAHEEFDTISAAVLEVRGQLGRDRGVTDDGPIPTVWEGIRLAHAVGRRAETTAATAGEEARAISTEARTVAVAGRARAGAAYQLAERAQAAAVVADGRANDAMARLHQWQTSQTSVAGLGARVATMEGNAVTRAELDTTIDGMESVLKPVFESVEGRLTALEAVGPNSLGGAQPPSAVGGHGGDRYTQLEKQTAVQLKELESRLTSQAVQANGRWFRTRECCVEFSRDHVPEGQMEWFLDIVSVLQFTGEDTVDPSESRIDEMHSARVKRPLERSIVISAFKTDIPPVFSGPKEGREMKYPLPGIKTPEMWDAHDGIRGVKPRVSESLADQRTAITGGINLELAGHPAARGLALNLLEESFTFWTSLCAEVGAFYQYLLTTTYGTAPPPSGKTECWTVVVTMLRVVWRELRHVRAPAATAYGYAERNPHLMVGQYLWCTLQAHRVMREFMEAGFRRHPKVSPGIVMYLFEHRAPKAELAALQTANAAQKRKLEEQARTIADLQKSMNRVQERVHKLEQKK